MTACVPWSAHLEVRGVYDCQRQRRPEDPGVLAVCSWRKLGLSDLDAVDRVGPF